MKFRENALAMAEGFERRASFAEKEARRHRETAADLRTRVAVEDALGGEYEPGWYERSDRAARD